MNKSITYLGLAFLLLGIMSAYLVFAGNGNGQVMAGNSGTEETVESEDLVISPGQGQQMKSQVITSNEGEEVEIQVEEQTRLRVRNISANTGLNITQEKEQNRTRLKVHLSNGQNAEIKVMPNTASETAIARLRLRVCSEENNCTIQLKEVGQGIEARLAYEVRAEKQAKVFGLFKTRMQTQAQVDAENGEVIATKKPWWAFLASESDE